VEINVLVKERKLAYCGYVLRKRKGCLDKNIIQGTTPGYRARGRPKTTTWLNSVEQRTDKSEAQLTRLVEERESNGRRLFVMRPGLVARSDESQGRTRQRVSRNAASVERRTSQFNSTSDSFMTFCMLKSIYITILHQIKV